VAALEARNRSAAGGLELFYRLELAHAQREVILDSLDKVKGALEDRKRLLAQGMTIPAPLDELRQQRFDLQSRLVELDQAIERLSNELKDLLSLGPQGEPWLVWPLAEVRVDTHPIDVEAAVQIGLDQRPEVGLLRRLDSMQSSDTMRALQLSLSMVNPLLGMSCGSSALSCRTLPRFLHCRGNESEDLASLRSLWDIYREAREQEIAKEIRSAALEVQASLKKIIVANERLRYWEARIGQIKAREASGAMAMSPLEQTQAELKRLEALAALWKSIADWQIAVVHLRREQFCLMP
jgi:outer membrane protein TolC